MSLKISWEGKYASLYLKTLHIQHPVLNTTFCHMCHVIMHTTLCKIWLTSIVNCMDFFNLEKILKSAQWNIYVPCTKTLKGHRVFVKTEWIVIMNPRIGNPFSRIRKSFPWFTQLVPSVCNFRPINLQYAIQENVLCKSREPITYPNLTNSNFLFDWLNE